MRLGAVFIAFCMILIAGSAGAIVYLGLGFAVTESIIVALSVLTALGLYNTVSTRLGARAVVGSQLSDLSRGNSDLARQVGEMGRRLAALEGRIDTLQNRARMTSDPLTIEMNELSTLVKQLADTVAAQDAKFTDKFIEIERTPRAPDDSAHVLAAADSFAQTASFAETASPAEATAAATSPDPPLPDDTAPIAVVVDADAERLAVIRSAVEDNRIDLYLQPIVTLPQRKVRYYEAMSRLRTEQGDVLQAAEFVELAQQGGLMAKIDNLVVFRCVQVVRRLLLKNREIGLFCNVSMSTLTDAAVFQQLLDFLDANRAIASNVVLEFTQSALRSAGPIENESLSALADRGFRFSLDNLQDLRMEPKELATRGFRFIKVPGSLLLSPNDAAADIHPADLSDLLGRFGIDLIAEKIESEPMVVDLLDYDVRFGQGFLFSPPRPVRAEALAGIGERSDVVARETDRSPSAASAAPISSGEPNKTDSGTSERVSALAKLARGASRV